MSTWNNKSTFLCGHRKSGTTMLLSLFDGHPDLAVFPPDSGFFYGVYPNHTQDTFSKAEKIERVIHVLYRTNFKNDLEKLSATPKQSFDYQRLETYYKEAMETKDATPGNLLSEAIYAFQKTASELESGFCEPEMALRWIEKTTSTEIYASEVLSWFPQAKFIHIIRDPRDNYASLKSGWKARYQEQNDSVNRLLQSMFDRGLLGYKCGYLNQELFPEQYKLLKFEDLVLEPEKKMRELCTFLEIPFHENVLKPTYYGLPWKGNNFDGLRFSKPSAQNVNRWKERISDHEAQVIEFYFKEMMDKFGYSVMFSPAEQLAAAREHYKWYNFAQTYSVNKAADTYQKK